MCVCQATVRSLCVVTKDQHVYTTIGELSSTFEEFLGERSQLFEGDHDQIWHACADRSGNGSYLNKLAP